MTYYVGIDIAKLTFEACLIMNNKEIIKSFNNDPTGFKAFHLWLNKQNKTPSLFHVSMEATGYYSDALARYLHQAEIKVSIVNPSQIKYFSGSKMIRVKTDKSDAKLIARFGEMHKPSFWVPAPNHIYDLRHLLNQLEMMGKYQRQEKARLKESPAILKEEISFFLKQLETCIENIKQRIRTLVAQHPSIANKVILLRTIPAVGEMTAWRMVSFLFESNRFQSAKQVAAYLGLNPKLFCSGTSINRKARLSKMGDRTLRKALYMPAIVAKYHNPVIKSFCERLEAQGKHKMLVIGAAMRKLVHIIYGVLKSERAFDSNCESALPV